MERNLVEVLKNSNICLPHSISSTESVVILWDWFLSENHSEARSYLWKPKEKEKEHIWGERFSEGTVLFSMRKFSYLRKFKIVVKKKRVKAGERDKIGMREKAVRPQRRRIRRGPGSRSGRKFLSSLVFKRRPRNQWRFHRCTLPCGNEFVCVYIDIDNICLYVYIYT